MSNKSKSPKLTSNAKKAYQTQKTLFLWIILSWVPNAFSFICPEWEVTWVIISYLIFPLLFIFLWQNLFKVTLERDVLIKNQWVNNILIALYLGIEAYFMTTWIVYIFAKQECMKWELWVNIRQCLQEAGQNRFINFR